MNRLRFVVILVAGLGVSALATAGALTATLAPPTPAETALHVACGMSFIGVGVLTWSRGPATRVGMLMTAAGFAWFLADLRYIPGSVSFTIADYAGRTLFYAIVAHLFLAFPSGHLRSRTDRVITAVVYLWIGLSNLGPEAFFAAPGGGPVPDNLLAIHRDAHLHTLAGNAHQVANVALTLIVFGVVLAHWAKATPPGRRALAPVCLASGPIVVAVVSLNAVGVVGQLDWLNTLLPTMTPLLLMTLPFAFLVGLVRSGLDRIAVGHLVVELGETQPPGHLRDALALTLHDPSLQLVYWLPATGAYVDSAGNPVVLPPPGSGRVVTLLEREGQPVAALLHDPSLEDDPWLIDAVAAAACLAVENERLHADLAAQLAEVRASRARIIEAGDAERRRVERDLHDGAQQRMVSLALALRLAVDQVGTAPDEAVRRSLTGAADQLRQALAELRELVNGIHPAVLTEGGLGPALQSISELAPVPVVLASVPDERFPQPVEAAAYFVVREALANIGKHAGAHAASVGVRHTDGRVVVEVADDGVGGADSSGSGLCGLADRVAALDGELEVISPLGGGTRVVATIPCA